MGQGAGNRAKNMLEDRLDMSVKSCVCVNVYGLRRSSVWCLASLLVQHFTPWTPSTKGGPGDKRRVDGVGRMKEQSREEGGPDQSSPLYDQAWAALESGKGTPMGVSLHPRWHVDSNHCVGPTPVRISHRKWPHFVPHFAMRRSSKNNMGQGA